MNLRKISIAAVALVTVFAFIGGVYLYRQHAQRSADQTPQQSDRLVRPHAYIFGPRDAPVTLVEFFDPACEACRAFYPYVKRLLAQYPRELRLVVRYAPFHEGSESVVRLLEAARQQNKYEPVLEAVLREQSRWADHGNPNLNIAYELAKSAGLDLTKALAAAGTPEVSAVLTQDVQDLKALGVERTPTFFVNGRALASFGPQQLADLVAEEVGKARNSP